MLRRLALAIALPACASPAAPPAPLPPSPPSYVGIHEPREPELFGFWLLGQSSWQGTLYGVSARGTVHEAETITSNDALWTEPVGTLHWVEGCAEPGGCTVAKTCPISGRLRVAPETPASPCDAFVLDLLVSCSDGEERRVRATFDGACDAGEEPTANIYVNGEPGTDGRLPGWDRISAARYRICASSESCRAEVAELPVNGPASSAPRLAAPRHRPPRAPYTRGSRDRATDGNDAS